mgnify:CR=1 FL=1
MVTTGRCWAVACAELQRLFARPQGRGLGLGRGLINARLDVAKSMGIKTVLADTLRKTTTMQVLYKELGFRQIEKYPESHSATHFPQLLAELRYYQLDL